MLGEFAILIRPALGAEACISCAMMVGVLTDGGFFRHKIIWCILAIILPVLSLSLYFELGQPPKRHDPE